MPHLAAMKVTAAHLAQADEGERSNRSWLPDFSRRARRRRVVGDEGQAAVVGHVSHLCTTVTLAWIGSPRPRMSTSTAAACRAAHRRRHVVRATHVAEQRAQLRGDDELRAHRRRKVQAGVNGADEIVEQLRVECAALDELDAWMVDEVLDVLAAPCRQVDKQCEFAASGEEGVGKVRTDETGAAGNQVPLPSVPPVIVPRVRWAGL
jgi:hypothetical protein